MEDEKAKQAFIELAEWCERHGATFFSGSDKPFRILFAHLREAEGRAFYESTAFGGDNRTIGRTCLFQFKKD